DLGLVSSLESYWDTLGWVAFGEGKLDLAEKYVSAAWTWALVDRRASIWGRFTRNKARRMMPNIFMRWRSMCGVLSSKPEAAWLRWWVEKTKWTQLSKSIAMTCSRNAP